MYAWKYLIILVQNAADPAAQQEMARA